MFLVYIDELIDVLDTVRSGLMIGHDHIPAVLLADDTTILSSTKAGLQRVGGGSHITLTKAAFSSLKAGVE
jgi:hypothetical protein